MGVDASWPLQRAILAALREDGRVHALLGEAGEVTTEADTQVRPAIAFAGAVVRAWHSATFDGQDHEITLLLRTSSAGPAIGELSAAVIDVLHDADLPLPGHALIELEFERSETRPSGSDAGAHCRMTFRALTVSD